MRIPFHDDERDMLNEYREMRASGCEPLLIALAIIALLYGMLLMFAFLPR